MSGLKRSVQHGKNFFNFNLKDRFKKDIKMAKKIPQDIKGDVKGTKNYFSKPKFPTPVPAEMEDEYTTSRTRNRDMIRRRQSGGRSSTIMSDTLG